MSNSSGNISPRRLKIKELNPDLIPPSTDNYKSPGQGGSKIVVIGKPGTGKTTLITAILHSKKHIFPAGMVISGTEDSNGHYKKIFPDSFVYSKYDEDVVKNFIKRQKIARSHLENPWAVLLLDDCTDDTRIFSKPLQQGLYKNGRHWSIFYYLVFLNSIIILDIIFYYIIYIQKFACVWRKLS